MPGQKMAFMDSFFGATYVLPVEKEAQKRLRRSDGSIRNRTLKVRSVHYLLTYRSFWQVFTYQVHREVFDPNQFTLVVPLNVANLHWFVAAVHSSSSTTTINIYDSLWHEDKKAIYQGVFTVGIHHNFEHLELIRVSGLESYLERDFRSLGQHWCKCREERMEVSRMYWCEFPAILRAHALALTMIFSCPDNRMAGTAASTLFSLWFIWSTIKISMERRSPYHIEFRVGQTILHVPGYFYWMRWASSSKIIVANYCVVFRVLGNIISVYFNSFT